MFSESVDTLRYLYERLGRSDALLVHAGNLNRAMRARIRANFDANAPADERRDELRILLCSDALAEGVNLHRANIIVNYDTPWNVTRLMQRIGRVNRIGSTAPAVHNFLFYPSDQGNRAIGLYQNALLKMQGFHAALGEDAQIYSVEEIVKEFQLFDPDVKDETDDTLRLLRIVRDLRASRYDVYRRIKDLPPKCRVLRKSGSGKSGSIVHLRSSRKTGFYQIANGKANPIDFLSAVTILEAPENEKPLNIGSATVRSSTHYRDVSLALDAFRREAEDGAIGSGVAPELAIPSGRRGGSQAAQAAAGFLRRAMRWSKTGGISNTLDPILADLSASLAAGTYAHLEFGLRDLSKEFRDYPGNRPLPPAKAAELEKKIRDLHAAYLEHAAPASSSREEETDPVVVLSETFVS